MTIACPRHGVVAAPADSPCPDCHVALYDLTDRNARDVVRANRFSALSMRRLVFTVGTLAVGGFLAVFTHGPITIMNLNMVGLIGAVAVGKFLAEPFARAVEPKPALRALDSFLDKNRI